MPHPGGPWATRSLQINCILPLIYFKFGFALKNQELSHQSVFLDSLGESYYLIILDFSQPSLPRLPQSFPILLELW